MCCVQISLRGHVRILIKEVPLKKDLCTVTILIALVIYSVIYKDQKRSQDVLLFRLAYYLNLKYCIFRLTFEKKKESYCHNPGIVGGGDWLLKKRELLP